MSDSLTFVNKKLKELYGCPVDNPHRSYFRIVDSDSQIEIREGEFEDYTDNGIFLRRLSGISEVKKYNYLKPQWILERYIEFNPDKYSLLQHKWSYEPLYTFGHEPNGNRKPLVARAIIFMINLMQNGPKTSSQEYMSNFMDEYFNKEAEESAEFEADLNNDTDFYGFSEGSAVSLGGKSWDVQ